MSQPDTRFEGGGTPIGQLIEQPQQHPQQPQYHQPQYQPPQYHQQPQEEYQYQPIVQPIVHRPRPTAVAAAAASSLGVSSDWFMKAVGVKWQYLVTVVLLFLVFSNSAIYAAEKQFIPMSLRSVTGGNPPLILVIFNALIVGAIFLVTAKFV